MISAAPTVSCASILETFTPSTYSTMVLFISTSLPLSASVLPRWCVSQPLQQSHICSQTSANSARIISTISAALSLLARCSVSCVNEKLKENVSSSAVQNTSNVLVVGSLFSFQAIANAWCSAGMSFQTSAWFEIRFRMGKPAKLPS